jgi:uncharacterized protein
MIKATSLVVKVYPHSSDNMIVGWSSPGVDRELIVKVCAPPDDNKANRAACEMLAKSIGIAKSKVVILRGAHTRHKHISFEVDERLFQTWCDGFPTLYK